MEAEKWEKSEEESEEERNLIHIEEDWLKKQLKVN